jgi:hypothetical protein
MKPITNKLALAGAAAALCVVAACSNGSDGITGGGQGRVQFTMSTAGTAPVAASVTDGGSTTDHSLQSANVTFSSILARNLDGQLIDVTIELPVTVDVLGLASNGSITLPAGFLPPGTYDQIVIVMAKLELTLANGTIVTIDPPGGGWTSIVRVAEPFTVVEGLTTDVTIRFRPDRSFRWLGSGWGFNPEFDCDGGGNNDDGDDEDDD